MKHTIDRSHDKSNLSCIRCAGKVGINLLGLCLVERDESVQDVIARGIVVGATLVVGEVILHWADRKLLLESINLVQEQNDRSLDKPSGVADGIEKGERFLHTVDGLIFEEQLIIFGDGDQEENCGDILEAVNPLLAFRSLTTNIKHAVGEIADDKGSLSDTSSLDTRSQNILVAGNIIWCGDTLDRVKVTKVGTSVTVLREGIRSDLLFS